MQRRSFSAEFKAKVALEAIKGDKTLIHRTEEDELFFRTFSSTEERKAALKEFLMYYKEEAS